MSIGIKHLLQHAYWADQALIGKLLTMDDSVLALYSHDENYTVGYLIAHIASGGDWYQHILTTKPLTYVPTPKTMPEAAGTLKLIASLDMELVALADGENDLHIVPNDDLNDARVNKKSREMVLSQVVHHATEHRAQLVSILNHHKIFDISCDDYDLWCYDNYLKSEPIK